MPTNAELAAKLLRNAAEFFRSVGAQDKQLDEQMRANAQTYDAVAGWVEKDAGGEGPPGNAGTADVVAGEGPPGPASGDDDAA